jgi:hypothetical protein
MTPQTLGGSSVGYRSHAAAYCRRKTMRQPASRMACTSSKTRRYAVVGDGGTLCPNVAWQCEVGDSAPRFSIAAAFAWRSTVGSSAMASRQVPGKPARRREMSRAPAMRNGRCRMHDGPPPGAPKGNKNALKASTRQKPLRGAARCQAGCAQ